MYGADGRFDLDLDTADRKWSIPEYIGIHLFGCGGHSWLLFGTDSLPARVALFRGNEIIRVDSLLMGQSEENGVAGVNDIAMISVLKDGGSGVVLIKGKDGRSAIYSLGNTYFWNIDKELYFHHSYNDTIYQIQQ